MKPTFTLLALCVLPMLVGCGGGGSGSSSDGATSSKQQVSSPTKATTVSAAATPTPVRAGPTATSAPVTVADTPTPGAGAQTLTIHPGESILAAVRGAPAGSTLVVAPGLYGSLSLQASDVQGPITLLADVTGALTESGAEPVIIAAATADIAAVQMSGVTGLTIDGFTLKGGREEAVLVSASPQTTIRNCNVSGSLGDGVFVEGSDQVAVYNNLIVNNRRAGMRVWGGSDLQAVNNTVYGNHDNGLSIGDVQEPAASVAVINNIVDANLPSGIIVDATTADYTGNFNLNADGYGSDTPQGPNDIVGMDPVFIDARDGDFHLAQVSPAVDAGDSAIDADLLIALQQDTTQTDGSFDLTPIDLGFHYPAPPPTPTPVPRNTKPKATPTP